MLLEMKETYITTEELNDLWQRSLVEMEKEFGNNCKACWTNNLLTDGLADPLIVVLW